MSEPERPAAAPAGPRRRGCLITLAVLGGLTLFCGAGIGLVGWQAWSSPAVQLGVRAAGAAMEMNQEALQAPGAQAVRDMGCRHAMVYSPALMARFVDQLEAEEGRIVAPSAPLIVCASIQDPPACETLAVAYAEAIGPGADAPGEAPEILIDVFVQSEAPPRCYGVYGPDGTRLRDQTEDEARFGGVVRPRVF